nr:class B sortase [Clostridia bacterium]
MKRMLALLIMLLMLSACVHAEEMVAPSAPVLEKEQVHAIVEQLFMAAAGSTEASEKTDRKGMTPEQCEQRNAEKALYRAKVRPWLISAFQVETEVNPEQVEYAVTAAPAEAAASAEEVTPVWTLADSWLALQENEQGRLYLSMLEPLGSVDMESCLRVTRQVCQQWLLEIDHAALLEQNGDYVCWIYAAGMTIDYPVVQDDNNDYYLNRMFNGQRNASGTLFIDYRNLPDFQDPNTLIYGHQMRNKSMFGMLDEYATQEFYEGHPYMLLISAKGISLVEIFAAYTTSSKDHCYDIALSDEEDMRTFVETALKKSDVVTGVEVLPSDHLVTLSTCAYSFENARYIAIGRLEPVLTYPNETEETPGE